MNSREILLSMQGAARTTSRSYDAVVSGAGLGGLATALEATKAGKNVLVIECRQERYAAIRPQLIFLDLPMISYLQKLSTIQINPNEIDTDKIFIEKLALGKHNCGGHFSIKDIQRYLMRRIDRKRCVFQYEAIISQIDLDLGYVTVGQERIHFKHLVLADGAKRQTANLLKSHIKYQSVTERPEKKHVMGYFTVKAKDGTALKPIEGTMATIIHNERCGYIYHESPATQNESATKIKVCIVMHVTDEQFEKYKSDSELGIKFLKHCVAGAFADSDISITNSKKFGEEKDKLKYATFMLDFTEASKSAFEHNGHTVIFVGDTRRSPDFYRGHGGNDAIEDGRYAATLICEKSDTKTYNQLCLHRSALVSENTKDTQPIIEYIQAEVPPEVTFKVAAFDDTSHQSRLRQ